MVCWNHMRSNKGDTKVFDLRELRNRTQVFRDRAAAGKVLASMLKGYRDSDSVVLAIPAGGIAVAAVIALDLDLPLDVGVVSKITPSWNSEVGYGAVAFDGTVRLNENLLSRFNLSQEEIRKGIQKTKEKVARRVKILRDNRPLPRLTRRVILVDDGLASGFTLQVAIEALHKAGGEQIILAVPTAHEESIQRVIKEVEAIYCPNIRSGWSFAVADAYEEWGDLDDEEVIRVLTDFKVAKVRS
jgi:putative phosphoribosyl transferase